MTDRTDEDRSGGSSDTSSASDPFEYPADEVDDPSEPSDSTATAMHPVVTDGAADEETPEGVVGWIRWFWTSDTGPHIYVRDILTSLLIVLAIGVLLFVASGVWPPMVAVESGSMEPNIKEGDLIFIADHERFPPDEAIVNDGTSTGIVPADVAERHERTTFGGHGDVIVFQPDGNAGRTPIIHRAMFWVDEGENWYDRAAPAAIGSAENCEALDHCPAPHAGFITKGDNTLTNRQYDQASRLSSPVRPEWVVGTAKIRVPHLGRVRLLFSVITVEPVVSAGLSQPTDAPKLNATTPETPPDTTGSFEPAQATLPLA